MDLFTTLTFLALYNDKKNWKDKRNNKLYTLYTFAHSHMIQLILHTSRAPDLVSGELNILVRPGQLVSNSLLDD